MPANASRNSRIITGGAVLYAPQPTPKPSTTNRIGQKHISMRGVRTQERAFLVGVHRRSPPEESTGRTTGNQTLLGGRGRLNDTDREEAKEKERKRENSRGQGTRENPGGGGEGG